MNYNEFVNLVLKMRDSQKKYFHMRGHIALETAKQYEYQVDNAIKQYKEQTEGVQASLFDKDASKFAKDEKVKILGEATGYGDMIGYVQEVYFDQLANQHFYTIQVFSENRPSFYIAEKFISKP